jgi:3-oxoacyl-[acyl-carrier protein] reductase
VTKHFLIIMARATFKAAINEAAYRNAISHRKFGNAGSNCADGANNLMPWYERIVRASPIILHLMQIRVADSAILNFNVDIFRSQCAPLDPNRSDRGYGVGGAPSFGRVHLHLQLNAIAIPIALGQPCRHDLQMTDLTGKNALVTGGSRGIGAAIVRRLLAAGADVAFTYAGRKTEAELLAEEFGGKPSVHQIDIRSPDAVKALFGEVDARFGSAPSLDILINNAGYGSDGVSSTALGETQEAQFDQVFDTNVKGTFFVSQEAMPRLRDGGRVIHIGSVAGRGAQAPSAAYGMTKTALQSLTWSMASALAKRRITVNTIAPGAVDTEFIARLRAIPGWDEGVAKNTPFGRLGTPDDIAGAVMMMLGPDAAWVTGQVIEASGGLRL